MSVSAPPTYDVYDQGVEGFLQEVEEEYGGGRMNLAHDEATAFKIRNLAQGSPIQYAIVTVPCIPGRTIYPPIPLPPCPVPAPERTTRSAEVLEVYVVNGGKWYSQLEENAVVLEREELARDRTRRYAMTTTCAESEDVRDRGTSRKRTAMAGRSLRRAIEGSKRGTGERAARKREVTKGGCGSDNVSDASDACYGAGE